MWLPSEASHRGFCLFKVIAGAQMAKASRIIGVDIDPAKFETGELAVGSRAGEGSGTAGRRQPCWCSLLELLLLFEFGPNVGITSDWKARAA